MFTLCQGNLHGFGMPGSERGGWRDKEAEREETGRLGVCKKTRKMDGGREAEVPGGVWESMESWSGGVEEI